jgi:hypothetical protein
MNNERYYNSLNTTNNKEQTLFGQLQKAFTNAISTSKDDSNLMVNEYISAQDKRRKCQKNCEEIKNSPSCVSVQDFIYMNTKTGKNWNYTPGKNIGHRQSSWKCKSSCSDLGGIGKPTSNNWCVCKKCKHSPNGLASTLGMLAKIGSMGTRATPKEAVTDTINSCKAGCELEWPGILNLDKGETVGRYYTSNKKKHEINTCPDLSKYAPKVKLGGKCDANGECETNTCVTWAGKCALNKWDKLRIQGRCGLSGVRVDGGNWAWGSTYISLCKKDVEKLGLVRWDGIEQYIIYSGHWIRVENFGLKTVGEIPNQRLENGLYIQDFGTALRAAKAYGERCRGFVKTSKGFILQDSGIGVSKSSWRDLKSELGLLNNTIIREGFTADTDKNKRIAQDKSKAYAWGKLEIGDKGWSSSSTPLTNKEYNNPTFPIAGLKKGMEKTCPKGWQSIRGGKSCGIFNDDIGQIQQSKNYNSEKYGWKGVSFGCNLPNTDNHYSLDCENVPDKSYTCWKKPHETIKKGEPACKTIKGRDIAQCYSEGGRPREFKCPTAAKIIVWVGRSWYSFNRDNIIPMLQEVEAIFPDVRMIDQKEMDDIVAKNIAICACGWYRKDVFSGTTWRTANSSWNGPGLENLPLGNGYPSNHNTQGGCGGGSKSIITCSQNPNAWNRGKGGVFITFSGTQEFSLQQLQGIGLNPLLVMSHQQVMEKPPNEEQVWSIGPKKFWNSSGGPVYQTKKTDIVDGGSSGQWPTWNYRQGELDQLSTGNKEVYGVNNGGQSIWAHAKNPEELNSEGRHGWRSIPGALSNISASNRKWVFGTNKNGAIYQCKKPCKGSWQRIGGSLSQISGGQNHVYGVNRNDAIYRKPINNDGAISYGWIPIRGRLKWINAANKNYVYGTNRADNVYVCKKPCTGDWRQMESPYQGGLKKIEADKDKVYGVNRWRESWSKPMDAGNSSVNFKYWQGGARINVSPEPFTGSIQEGYAPLEGDMIKACKYNDSISAEKGVSLGRTGDYLIKQRKKMLKSAASLERNADAAVNAISQMQGEQLQISPQALSQNQNLLSKLANYQKAKSTLLKGRGELETLRGVLQDNELKKKSNDIMYYVWLTLAISILVTAIRKIK